VLTKGYYVAGRIYKSKHKDRKTNKKTSVLMSMSRMSLLVDMEHARDMNTTLNMDKVMIVIMNYLRN
jgi:hypothetical protein